jgi:hypothetical protein
MAQGAERVIVAEAFAEQVAEVHAGDADHGLDALFGQRGIDRIATAAANPNHADAVFVDIGERHRIVDNAANILNPLGRIFNPSRASAGFALEAGVIGNDNETLLRERFAVDISRGLLLATSERMDTDERRIFPVLVETRREQNVRGDVPGHVCVLDLHGFHDLSPLKMRSTEVLVQAALAPAVFAGFRIRSKKAPKTDAASSTYFWPS